MLSVWDNYAMYQFYGVDCLTTKSSVWRATWVTDKSQNLRIWGDRISLGQHPSRGPMDPRIQGGPALQGPQRTASSWTKRLLLKQAPWRRKLDLQNQVSKLCCWLIVKSIRRFKATVVVIFQDKKRGRYKPPMMVAMKRVARNISKNWMKLMVLQSSKLR